MKAETKERIKRMFRAFSSDVLDWQLTIIRLAYRCFLGYWIAKAAYLFALFIFEPYTNSTFEYEDVAEIAKLLGWLVGLLWVVVEFPVNKAKWKEKV